MTQENQDVADGKQTPNAPGNIDIKIRKAVVSKRFAHIYVALSLLVLLASSSIWATLSARLQLSNASQLVNGFLFHNLQSVHEALLPSSQSLLIKWPLFLLIGTKSALPTAFVIATICLVLVTLIGLALLVTKITDKPLLAGTIILAISSMLLLSPAASNSGILLPDNMAMLAVRNIEHIVYIIGLVFIVRSRRVAGKAFLIGLSIIALSIANDAYFVFIGVGGAILMAAIYTLYRQWSFVHIALRWLTASTLGSLIAFGLLLALSMLGFTHIVFGERIAIDKFTYMPKEIFLNIVRTILDFLSHFGANPSHAATELSAIPREIYNQIADVSTLTYIINFALLVIGIGMISLLFKATISYRPKQAARPQVPVALSMMLLAAALFTFITAIFTKHDAFATRQFTFIFFFAIAIGATAYANIMQWRSTTLVVTGFVLLAGIIAGSPSLYTAFHKYSASAAVMNEQTIAIQQALANHKVDYLVGDYERVVPANLSSTGNFAIAPLESCITFSQTRTSTTWQPDLKKHSFAYLLTLDSSAGRTHAACNLDTVQETYGQPNASLVIAGTPAEPKELLLFYDFGENSIKTSISMGILEQIQNLTKQIPNECVGKTTLDVVAHQDDDLLFMNPAIYNKITSGGCVTTVYMTAGDGGSGNFYWLRRRQGSEAAYSLMLGQPVLNWSEKTYELDKNYYITIATPVEKPNISIIFMNIPDGNVNGDGFSGFGNQSLAKLWDGNIQSIRTVDGLSDFTKNGTVNTLLGIMSILRPSEVWTQSFSARNAGDHSDHQATGKYTKSAFDQYLSDSSEQSFTPVIRYYIGYPIRELPENLSPTESETKKVIFESYARNDSNICGSPENCSTFGTYEAYLWRQYRDDTIGQ